MRKSLTNCTKTCPRESLKRPWRIALGNRGESLRILALGGALAGAMIASGCASQRHCPPPPETPEKPAGFPCGPCAGYFPTCWRPWPDVCPSCPVFGLEEPKPTEMPAESVPLPPTLGEPSNPAGTLESPEMEAPPAESEPAKPDEAQPEESPANDQARAPAPHLGRPTSRRVVHHLPEWQMPPLPESRQTAASPETAIVEDEERPVRTPRVFRTSQQGEPSIKRADR
jgi:hypothetical protein